MKMFTKSILPLIGATVMCLAGCPSDDTTGTGDGTESADTTNGPTTMTTMTTLDTTATVGTTTTTATGTGTTTGATETMGSSTTGPDPNDYDFREDPPEDYTQVERMGMPAVNTGLITDKDAYNVAMPTADVAGDFYGEVEDNLNLLHIGPDPVNSPNGGLEDDLAGLSVPTCREPADTMVNDECTRQLGQFIFPDVIAIDTEGTAGFPNGRLLEDRVMDIILALILLDVSDEDLGGATADGVPLTALFDLSGINANLTWSLNPDANDVAFPGDWPYLAPAN